MPNELANTYLYCSSKLVFAAIQKQTNGQKTLCVGKLNTALPHAEEMDKKHFFDLSHNNYDTIVFADTCELTDILPTLYKIHTLLVEQGGCFFFVFLDQQRNLKLSYVLNLISKAGFNLLTPIPPAIQNSWCLLHLQKKQSLRWTLTHLDTEHKFAFIDLFNTVFHPNTISPIVWDWKYRNGRGVGITAWRTNQLVASYGGLRRAILYFGQAKQAVQIVDIMVHPQERGVFTRRGAFALTGSTFPEYYVGYDAPFWLGFGFPTERHYKLSEKLGLYAEVGRLLELRWSSQTSLPHWHTRIRYWLPQENPDEQVILTSLWQVMATDLNHAIVGVRDWAQFQYRYCQHPEKKYEILLMSNRWHATPHCLVVVKVSDNNLHIVDYIGQLHYIPDAIAQVRRIAARRGMAQVFVWITANFADAFRYHNPIEQDLNIVIPHSIWADGVPAEVVKDHWWLMAGDTDFI